MNANASANEELNSDQIRQMLETETKTSWTNWDLKDKTREEQAEWFHNLIVLAIGAGILPKGDLVDEIIIAEPLRDALLDALTNPEMPEKFPENLHADWPAIHGAIESIQVRGSDPEKMLPMSFGEPVEQQFCQLMTRSRRAQMQIDSWDRSIGFSESMRNSNILAYLTAAERRHLFFMWHLLRMSAGNMRNLDQASEEEVFSINR